MLFKKYYVIDVKHLMRRVKPFVSETTLPSHEARTSRNKRMRGKLAKREKRMWPHTRKTSNTPFK